MFEDDEPVIPNGMAIRRLRRDRGWSRRDFVREIGDASERASGLRVTLTMSQLGAIEETSEEVTYRVVCQVARGLDADPIDLVRSGAA